MNNWRIINSVEFNYPGANIALKCHNLIKILLVLHCFILFYLCIYYLFKNFFLNIFLKFYLSIILKPDGVGNIYG